ncbi:hypothetical protein [Neoroseomonas oryzicola]|uniref:DUF883 domain-containing protein n=1 Tax=Neoroseomonas oryzicola TaxID=535904 RepID=A0A9X9WC14_9PROT|nr:hypothetical protein [Neoroseomonas oryzicola]MBR0657874.1 hypothetical protein [Neoroseomonas oryzicola]NKE18558.1 hypothetical protein [Neoroseomonas oryzicola]
MRAKVETNETPTPTPTLTEAAAAELAVLREKVDALVREHLTPAVDGVGDRAAEARDALRAGADGIAERVREQPFVALGAAAMVGIALGVLLRR